MASRAKKSVRILQQEFGDEDRLSRLPDDLLHKILSYVDAREAVQTSILSRRWKPVWTTLPFLSFGRYAESLPKNVCRFMSRMLSKRNRRSNISDFNLCVHNAGFSNTLFEKYVKHAVSHNVQSLSLEFYDHFEKLLKLPTFKLSSFKLSIFSSMSLKKLTLNVTLEECALQSDLWVLPALTTLHLKCRPITNTGNKFVESWFRCLPALRTLFLYSWNLSHSYSSFSLPELTTLCLSYCRLPKISWDFRNLLSLQLDGEYSPDIITDILSALINLRNLTLSLPTTVSRKAYVISCPPHLLNLSIITSFRHYFTSCYFVVLAPKLRNFTFLGIFTATIGVFELETVNVRLQGWFPNMEVKDRNKYYLQFKNMLLGLNYAKNLTFDSESIKALNEISNLLVRFPSPFCKLKYVKLPMGFEESSISSALRSYLLGGSPNATFVTKLPQNHGMEDSMVDADKVGYIDAFMDGTNKDQASSLRGERDSGLWQSHEINSEFVCLLDRIMHKYPETFQHFTTKNKKLCTKDLNLFCTSLNDISKISMANVDSEVIVGYMEVFSYLQNQGFNVSWVVERLNYVEHLSFSKPLFDEIHSIDCHIIDAKIKLQELQARANDAKFKPQDPQVHVDDAKTKLQNVQTLRMEKMIEIEKACGTMGTKLAVGFIGDDLLSNP